MSFKNVKLRTKILVGIGVPMILALGLGIISIMKIRSMITTEEWVEHTHTVIGEAKHIVASAVDMETGMRGYLLAGKEDFLAPYQNGKKATYDAIKSLKNMVSDNLKQVERLGEVETILQEWQESVTEPTIALRREIGDAETMNDMAALIKEARGKVYFDTFRTQIATFIAREETLIEQRQQAVEEATAQNEANAKFITEAAVWVDHTQHVIETANEILATAVDMETGMRGFLLAGKEEFLDPYKAGQKEFSELAASLSKTVADNPAQVKLLGEIKITIEEWQEQVTEPAIALRRNGGIETGTTMEDVAALVGQARGTVYFDRFRDQIATFIAREEALIVERQQTAVEATAAAAANRKSISEATEWVDHTQHVIETANRVLATAVDMETGMRGYLLAGNEDLLKPYNVGHERFDQLVAALSQTVADNPAQVQLLEEIKTTIDEWQEQIVETQIALRREIGDAKTMDDMADLVGEAHGKQYIDRFRGIMADFVGAEETLMAQRQEANASTVQATITSIVGSTIAAFVIGIFIAFVITRSITLPLNQAVTLNNRVANGELDLVIQVDRRDEIGQMLLAMKNMISKLKDIVSDVKGAANNVASGSQEMSSSAEEMSQGATEQAAAAEQASSSMEEMSANIRQNSENAMQTEQIASKAAKDAEKSGRAVAETVEAMKTITQKVAIIEEIARQTHMLSLNATIEAATAQEYGKGFGVVAAEVRELAERSRTAATEINQLATSSVIVAERAGKMLVKLVPDIQKTAELVQEISAASSEQNKGASQINSAIQQLDNVTQQNSAVSEGMSSTAEELASQAEHLQGTIVFFKVDETITRRQQQDLKHDREYAHVQHINGIKKHAAGTNGHEKSMADADLRPGSNGDAKDGEFEKF